jgi:TatA/E family protein of Tat protein translocase
MMGIGFPELMIILVIIMIIFGAGKLPEIGSAFGNSIKNFKKSMKEAEEIQEATNLESTETSEASEASEPSEGETIKEPAPVEDAKEN